MRVTRDKLERRIYKLHINNIRSLNDTHIFVNQAILVLERVRDDYRKSKNFKDKRYYVPFKGKSKFAQRTDAELKQIFDRYITSELYANFIIASVAQFESFLSDVLRLVIYCYPQKLSIKVKGISFSKDIPLEVVLESSSIGDIIEKEIDRRILEVFYATPLVYFDYFGEVTGVAINDIMSLDYIEIKATRDLLIHNSGVINQLYLNKAGNKSRGKIGDYLVVDSEYFDHCVAVMKGISGIIQRDIEENFG
jgi:hypothetical protein